MRRYASWLIGMLMLCALTAPTQAAETVEQDRRIEELKREELRPSQTTVAPTTQQRVRTPGQAQPPTPMGALPIYFLEMSQRFITYHYDAAKGMVVLSGKDDEYLNLDSQVRYMKEEGLLPRRYHATFDPKAPLRKGLLAVLLARVLNTRGGIALHIAPNSERYALKEMVHQGIMSPGYPVDVVSGQEFVSTMARAADQMARERLGPKPPGAP